jgi:hypothetical protein
MTSIFSIVALMSRVRPRYESAGARGGILSLALCLVFCAASARAAEESPVQVSTFCNGIRLQDEIVVVSTRNLCGSCDPQALSTGIRVENYAIRDEAGHRHWQRSDLESFLAFDPAVPTIVYVHGNQMTPGEAKSQGLAVYRKLAHYSSGEPVRYVIFSWPSSRVGRLLRDVRVKAVRTGPAGCQLGWLIDQMPAETHLSLIGFSFGARIVTGGLHVLGGGSLGGRLQLDERANPDRAPVDAVLIASALHCHWLGEGQYHGRAMSQVDRMFLLNNRSDLALRYYHLSTPGRDRPQALGLRGPTCLGGEYASKIQKRDVSRYAGRQHDLFMYLCAPGAMAQVWSYTDPAASRTSANQVTLNSNGKTDIDVTTLSAVLN